MQSITFDINEKSKTVTPKLPEPTIINTIIDSSSLDFFEANPSMEIDEVISLCKKDALRETKANGNITRVAKENLRNTIQALSEGILQSKGYTLTWDNEAEQ